MEAATDVCDLLEREYEAVKKDGTKKFKASSLHRNARAYSKQFIQEGRPIPQRLFLQTRALSLESARQSTKKAPPVSLRDVDFIVHTAVTARGRSAAWTAVQTWVSASRHNEAYISWTSLRLVEASAEGD